jgi:hypothetical protein
MMASGQLPQFTGQPENSRWVVAVQLEDSAAAELPQSAGASILAVYTERGKALHVISKVMLRMNAWTAYLTSP